MLCLIKVFRTVHHRSPFRAKEKLSTYSKTTSSKYKGDSNENLKNFLKYYLLCRSGTKLYHFSK